MSSVTLAVKYRPKTFDDVSEQGTVRTIIQNQIDTSNVSNAYLFTGGAGTGKTTLARIVADMINDNKGTPVELDAASNNSVDDVRNLIKDARFKPMDTKYRVYILDEVHMLSISAWNAMLKLLEEPPSTAVFIMCTTDPHKIPGTILSRVQRYNFQRISHGGIVNRLMYILEQELKEINETPGWVPGGGVILEEYYGTEIEDVCKYIATLANGGMRDAISMLDKCLALTPQLTVKKVTEILSGGITVYDFFTFTRYLMAKDLTQAMDMLNEIYMSGVDMAQFVKMYFEFLLNLVKYVKIGYSEYIQIPGDILQQVEEEIAYFEQSDLQQYIKDILDIINGPKVDVKMLVEAWVIKICT